MCSFCQVHVGPGGFLVAGPGATICGDCVDRIVTMRAPDAPRPAPASWRDLTDAELLDTLPPFQRVAAQSQDELRRWVGRARERGISWQRIGDALSMSRQSAWERFRTGR